jgi:hypothetical protein
LKIQATHPTEGVQLVQQSVCVAGIGRQDAALGAHDLMRCPPLLSVLLANAKQRSSSVAAQETDAQTDR